MIRYQGSLSDFSYEQIRAQLPHVRQEIYQVLVDLSPEQLGFLLKDLEPLRFNPQAFDTETLQVILSIIAEILGEKTALKRDEVVLAYARFTELLFLDTAIRSEIMMVKTTDTATDYFFIDGDGPESVPDYRVFRALSHFRKHQNRYS